MTIKTDSECLPLCKAVDKINGLRVLEASCGNGERPFTLWFAVEEDLKPLMQFLNILILLIGVHFVPCPRLRFIFKAAVKVQQHTGKQMNSQKEL
jgi:hypothetical protein